MVALNIHRVHHIYGAFSLVRFHAISLLVCASLRLDKWISYVDDFHSIKCIRTHLQYQFSVSFVLVFDIPSIGLAHGGFKIRAYHIYLIKIDQNNECSFTFVSACVASGATSSENNSETFNALQKISFELATRTNMNLSQLNSRIDLSKFIVTLHHFEQ